MKRFQYLKDRGWIDEQTLSLETKVVAFNYQLAIPRLIKVQFKFYFSFTPTARTFLALHSRKSLACHF